MWGGKKELKFVCVFVCVYKDDHTKDNKIYFWHRVLHVISIHENHQKGVIVNSTMATAKGVSEGSF